MIRKILYILIKFKIYLKNTLKTNKKILKHYLKKI
jgi:hypothetical protein